MNAERIQYWISKGARPSDTVHNILIDTKVITGKKVNAMNKKTKVVAAAAESSGEPKKEAPKEDPKAAAPVADLPADEAGAPKEEEKAQAEEAPTAETPASAETSAA